MASDTPKYSVSHIFSKRVRHLKCWTHLNLRLTRLTFLSVYFNLNLTLFVIQQCSHHQCHQQTNWNMEIVIVIDKNKFKFMTRRVVREKNDYNSLGYEFVSKFPSAWALKPKCCRVWFPVNSWILLRKASQPGLTTQPCKRIKFGQNLESGGLKLEHFFILSFKIVGEFHAQRLKAHIC
jgi:hypothetical protein